MVPLGDDANTTMPCRVVAWKREWRDEGYNITILNGVEPFACHMENINLKIQGCRLVILVSSLMLDQSVLTELLSIYDG